MKKKLAWIGSGLLLSILLLYFLRWPIFEGTVRGEIRSTVSDLLNADVEIEFVGGSLLTGIHARGIVLKPRDDAWFAEWTIAEVDVAYGWFGSGDPDIRIRGARVVLAKSDAPPTPLNEVIPDVVHALESLEIPGRLELRDSEAVLTDGKTVTLTEGVIEGRRWTVRARPPEFGEVNATATFDPARKTKLTAHATEGVLTRVALEMESAHEGRRLLQITAVIEGNQLFWSGEAVLNNRDRIERAEGELKAKEGKAVTRVDFPAGTAVLDVNGVYELQKPLRADLDIVGRVTATLDAPPKEWLFEDVTISTKNAVWRSLTIDEAKAKIGRGRGVELPFEMTARIGPDLASANGVLRLRKETEFEGEVEATIADAAPYLPLLDKPPDVSLTKIHLKGGAGYNAGGIVFEGFVETGAGRFRAYECAKIRVDGSFGSNTINVEKLVMSGSPFAPVVTASGRVILEENGGRIVAGIVDAGPDQLKANGSFTFKGELDGTFSLQGPADWLKTFDIVIPDSAKPLKLSGTAVRQGGKTDYEVKLGVGKIVSADMNLAVKMVDGEVHIGAAPGDIIIAERKLAYGDFTLTVRNSEIDLSRVKLSLGDPAVSALLSAKLSWEGNNLDVSFETDDPTLGDHVLDKLGGNLKFRGRDVIADIVWGREDGDHLIVRGTAGETNDFTVRARIRTLRNPVIDTFLRQLTLKGGIELNAKVTGTRESPEVSGSIQVKGVAVGDEPAVSCILDLGWKDNAVVIREETHHTPYGSLTIGGRIPLPWGEKPEPLAFSAAVEVLDLEYLLGKIPEDARAWIPKGKLRAAAWLRGPIDALDSEVQATYEFDEFILPDPVGRLTKGKIRAVLDEKGLKIQGVEGYLGKGAFRAEGFLELFSDEIKLTLDITGEDCLAVRSEFHRVRVSPDVTLTWSESKKRVKVSGVVAVPLVLWYDEFGPGGERQGRVREAAAPSLRLKQAGGGGFQIPGIVGLENIELDLAVFTTGECRIENSVVGMLIQAKGEVHGTMAEPAISGQISVHSGEVRLATGIFIRIVDAEASLPGKPGQDPTAHFEGRVGKGEGAISVVITGRLDQPTMTLNSNPPRSQQELLAYLAFGSDPGSFSGEAALGAIATKVIEYVSDDWPVADPDDDFLHKIHLSVFSEAEARQDNAPWELPTSGTSRGTVVRVEYPLSRSFSVIGETDLEGNVSGDVKFRIRFK